MTIHRLEEKEVRRRFNAFLVQFPWKVQEGMTFEQFEAEEVEASRNPTAGEINFGYGAIHYKTFPLCVWVHPKTGQLKKWIKCEYDGLRYYRKGL